MPKLSYHYKSVSDFLEVLNYEKSSLEHFALIDLKKLNTPKEVTNLKVTCEFYSIMFNNAKTNIGYGGNEYDLQSGAIAFVAPNQVAVGKEGSNSKKGWIICFSPKFLTDNLATIISNYNAFSYEENTALFINKKTEKLLNNCVSRIKEETNSIDEFSKTIICTEIEFILKHCSRSFKKVKKKHSFKKSKDILVSTEKILEKYYQQEKHLTQGVPKLSYLANTLNIPSRQLSQTIFQKTGIKTTDYINRYVINKSKTLLITTNKTINEIAYDLGFNQPHYFIKLFKKYNVNTPKEFRLNSQ